MRRNSPWMGLPSALFRLHRCLGREHLRSTERTVDKHRWGVTARSTEVMGNKHHIHDQISSHSSTLVKAQLHIVFHHPVSLSTKRKSFASTMKKMIPQLSPPGWALSVIAAITIIMQIPNIYNPSALMAEFQISNKSEAQLIGNPRSSTESPYYTAVVVRAKAMLSTSLFC